MNTFMKKCPACGGRLLFVKLVTASIEWKVEPRGNETLFTARLPYAMLWECEQCHRPEPPSVIFRRKESRK